MTTKDIDFGENKVTDNPVFLTGVYRSGTTLLTSVLAAHDDLDMGHPGVQYFRYILKKDKLAKDYKEIVKSISSRCTAGSK